MSDQFAAIPLDDRGLVTRFDVCIAEVILLHQLKVGFVAAECESSQLIIVPELFAGGLELDLTVAVVDLQNFLATCLAHKNAQINGAVSRL